MSPRSASGADHPLDSLDDRGLDALGRLVENQQARPGHKGAGDGQLLLLAARQIAAAAVQHVLQHRERAKISSGMLRSLRGRGAKPVCRFSSTERRGKISRPCGT